MVLFFRDQNAQILSGPTNQEVLSGDTAMFNCSIQCGNPAPVTWYLTLPTSLRTVIVTPYTQLNQIKSFYGIEVSRVSLDDCAQGGNRVEQLYVKAAKQLHLMPVQCYTLCFASSGSGVGCGCGTAQVYFSKVGLLSVADVSKSISTVPTTPTTSAVPYSSKVQDVVSSPAAIATSMQRATVTMVSTPTPDGAPAIHRVA
ncbi:hypothetical protein EMCRGX_G015706 [Ephydatia muelleri]